MSLVKVSLWKILLWRMLRGKSPLLRHKSLLLKLQKFREVEEPPIESVGILGQDATPLFPMESAEEESEESKFEVPAILSPELLAPTDGKSEAGTEASAEEEEIEDLNLFEY